MLDLLTTLYADDTLRFFLWDLFAGLGIDGLLAWVIESSGHVLYEDFSIGR